MIDDDAHAPIFNHNYHVCRSSEMTIQFYDLDDWNDTWGIPNELFRLPARTVRLRSIPLSTSFFFLVVRHTLASASDCVVVFVVSMYRIERCAKMCVCYGAVGYLQSVFSSGVSTRAPAFWKS